MNITTEKVEQESIPGQNYTVAALQRQVFARSNVAFIATNRDAINFVQGEADSSQNFQNKYNRLVGLDYNLASQNNQWIGKFFLHKSFTPEVTQNDLAHGVNLVYNTQTFKAEWNHQVVGENFNADIKRRRFDPRPSCTSRTCWW